VSRRRYRKTSWSGLCAKYEASAELQEAGAADRADLKRHLSVVRDGWADAAGGPEGDGARKALLDWRDRYKDTPKTADAYLGALALVLSWAKKRGDLPVNPLEKWPRLYPPTGPRRSGRSPTS
jgi:hypothetical protein